MSADSCPAALACIAAPSCLHAPAHTVRSLAPRPSYSNRDTLFAPISIQSHDRAIGLAAQGWLRKSVDGSRTGATSLCMMQAPSLCLWTASSAHRVRHPSSRPPSVSGHALMVCLPALPGASNVATCGLCGPGSYSSSSGGVDGRLGMDIRSYAE